MNQEKMERARAATVQVGAEAMIAEGSLLRVTAYPWGVEFDVVRGDQE